ncbi:MAG: hypothetical protein K2X91_16000, partial [Thermoleophilia bacterium]|nr:hypothetical protein [Thermoleophilia bacterium]
DALRAAAERLARDQSADGSWPIEDGQGSIGTPAAYGRPLATLVARDALAAADPGRFREPIAKADAWLRARPVARVMDASTYLLAFPRDDGPKATQALATLRAGRSADGGWGPFVDAPPEPFDTALALIALARRPPTDESKGWIAAGRAYLARSQADDGSWPETTRPAGLESYAQRLSTAGWATLALLSTAPREARPAP